LTESSFDAEQAFLAWLSARDNHESVGRDDFRKDLDQEARQEFDKLADDFLTLRARVGASQPDLQTGREIGRYRLIQELGSGAVGMVWEARDTRLGRHVALKLLYPHLAISDRAVQRFHQEARATAKLSHSSLVTLWSSGQTDNLHYLAQELVGDGRTLADVILERQEADTIPPDHWREMASHLAAIAEGVAHAHQHGVLHRDIKPGNILFDPSNTPRLTDFGLAKVADQDLSLTGEVVGTPFYMSPEQTRASVDASKTGTDIFSLGSVMYECLCLQRPFQGDSFETVAYAIQHKHPRRPTQISAQCPKDLESICLKALQKNPADRYVSAHALALDLMRFLQGEPVMAPPVSFTARLWRRTRRTLSSLGFVTYAPFWKRPTPDNSSDLPQAAAALLQDENWAALQKWADDLLDAGFYREAKVLHRLLLSQSPNSRRNR
jgi:serine/threonine protein kinase